MGLFGNQNKAQVKKLKKIADQVIALEDKYKDALMTGSVALEDLLPQIQSELEAIGFYEVLAETQTALDAYLAE